MRGGGASPIPTPEGFLANPGYCPKAALMAFLEDVRSSGRVSDSFFRPPPALGPPAPESAYWPCNRRGGGRPSIQVLAYI